VATSRDGGDVKLPRLARRDGRLLHLAAICRIDTLASMPREISSRSETLRAREERCPFAGAMPPCRTTTLKIEAACLPRARPISLNDCPFFHRFHNSALSSVPIALYCIFFDILATGLHVR
jgi:hypothetical protein